MIDPDKKVAVWHNQVPIGAQIPGLVDDYNELSPDEEKLPDEIRNRIVDMGYIPETNYLRVAGDWDSATDPKEVVFHLLREVVATFESKDTNLRRVEATLNILKDFERYDSAGKAVFRLIKELAANPIALARHQSSTKLLVSYYALYKLVSNIKTAQHINGFIPQRNTTMRDKNQQIMELLNNKSVENDLAKLLMPLFKLQLKRLGLDNSFLPNKEQAWEIITDFSAEVLYSGMGILAPLEQRGQAKIFRTQAQELLKKMGLVP